MTKRPTDIPTDDNRLADAYADTAMRNGVAIDQGDYRAANRFHDYGVALSLELLKRGPATRTLLLALLRHHDAWVRFWAAGDVREFAPAEAEQTLEQLSSMSSGLVRVSAETLLAQWRKERGTGA